MRGERVIHLHVDAPPKPAWGEPCNGCGLCCLTEPCPAGMLLSGRRHGACRLVHWDTAAGCYRCGLMSGAATLRPAWLAAVARRLARRWIASGAGCDAELDAQWPSQKPRDPA